MTKGGACSFAAMLARDWGVVKYYDPMPAIKLHAFTSQHGNNCNDVQDLHGNSRLSATKMGSSISNKWSRLHSLLQHLQFSGTSKLDFSYKNKADSLDVE